MAEKKALERYDWSTRNDLSREDELLVHCARLDLSQARRDAIKNLLSGRLDWDFLLERATWHRLLCLVSHHLRTADLGAFVPQPMLQKLQRINHLNLARNMFLQDGLSPLLSALNGEGIPVIVLKGSALLGSVYQDISLRPMSDLDILVQPQDLDRAEAVALCQGYVQVLDCYTHEEAKMKQHHLPSLIHPEKGIVLEIHQHIADSDSHYHFDLSSFWTRARSITIAGSGALTFAPEDLLIHLSISFLIDRCRCSKNALGQLCDISEVILRYRDSLNWNLIENVAKEHGIAPGLHCVLFTCEQLLSTQVLASVLARLQPLEFNPSMVTLFIRRRVLDIKPWLHLDLIASQSRYSRRGALLAIVNKILYIFVRIFKEKGFRRQIISYYFRLIRDTLHTLGRVLLKPTELKRDLLLDRWLHDIHRSTNGTRHHDSRSSLNEAKVS